MITCIPNSLLSLLGSAVSRLNPVTAFSAARPTPRRKDLAKIALLIDWLDALGPAPAGLPFSCWSSLSGYLASAPFLPSRLHFPLFPLACGGWFHTLQLQNLSPTNRRAASASATMLLSYLHLGMKKQARSTIRVSTCPGRPLKHTYTHTNTQQGKRRKALAHD